MHPLCQAGDIKLVIAAKVDVRDGTAWSSLDKYIKNIEGTPTAAGTPALQLHPSEHEAAGPATAAAVADNDEDGDALPGVIDGEKDNYTNMLTAKLLRGACFRLKIA